MHLVHRQRRFVARRQLGAAPCSHGQPAGAWTARVKTRGGAALGALVKASVSRGLAVRLDQAQIQGRPHGVLTRQAPAMASN
jgi:hypothetical protein